MIKKRLQLTALAITLFSYFVTKTMFIERFLSKIPLKTSFIASPATEVIERFLSKRPLEATFIASATTGVIGLTSYNRAFTKTTASSLPEISSFEQTPTIPELPIETPLDAQSSYTEIPAIPMSLSSFSVGSCLTGIGSYLKDGGLKIASYCKENPGTIIVGTMATAALVWCWYNSRQIKNNRIRIDQNKTAADTAQTATKRDIEELRRFTTACKDEQLTEIQALTKLTREQKEELLNKIQALTHLTKAQQEELKALIITQFNKSTAHSDANKKEVMIHCDTNTEKILQAIQQEKQPRFSSLSFQPGFFSLANRSADTT